MKQSNLTFLDGFSGTEAKAAKVQGKTQKAFDWDKAAQIIKDKYKEHADLRCEAGLQGDWEYTGGCIFKKGKPYNDSFTYLSSNWAIPTLILEWDGEEQEEIDCFIEASDSRFDSSSKWDKISLEILGIDQ